MNITSTDELLQLQAYLAARDAARNAVSFGLYPNAKAALEAYAALTARLAPGSDLEACATLHATTTADVQAYITQLISAAQAIVNLVDGINAGATAAGRVPPFSSIGA